MFNLHNTIFITIEPHPLKLGPNQVEAAGLRDMHVLIQNYKKLITLLGLVTILHS